MKSDNKILFDILKAALTIQSYIGNLDHDAFHEDPIVQDAVAMRLATVGESTNKLSEEIRNTLSKIPFHKLRGMRNIIAHNYERVDMDTVWKVAREHLPEIIPILTAHLAKTTDFEAVIREIHAGPTLTLIAEIHRPTSALNAVIRHAQQIGIASADELADAIKADAARRAERQTPSGRESPPSMDR